MVRDLQKIAIIAGERKVSFGEMLLRIEKYGELIPTGADNKVLVFSENREGWVYAFYSIWHNGSIAVPVDAGATAHDVAYILRDCTPQSIWVSHQTELVARQAIEESGVDVKVCYLDDMETLPVQGTYADSKPLPWEPLDKPGNDDTALIIYTSGTTGMPKGVMLSYANLFANVKAVCHDVHVYDPSRRTMMLLPVHHVLPLQGTLIIPMYAGGGIAICPSLSGPDLMDTMVRGKIAIVIGVPRLYQTLFTGIKKKIDASAVTRALYSLCETVGSRSLSRLVFGSVRKKMGGHIAYFVSGGAALDKEIGRGMKTLGLDVLEGYGMTETAPIIAFTRPDDIVPGCVGKPLPGVECKLENGELLARGGNVMKGYYNRPEETAAVLDKDGYIHTGDLATIDAEGHVTITGRCKEIIVLSNGKNVEPSEIEFKLEKYDTYVKEAAVVQDGDLLRAIIVPRREWADGISDTEAEVTLKREVLEPYNRTVSNYKKLMSLMVYRGDLPRTRMEKLQRFKLKDILAGKVEVQEETVEQEPELPEYQAIKHFIEEEKKVRVRPTSHVETDLAMDSLDKVSLQGFVENSFGVHIKAEEMASYPSILAMAEHVAEKKTHSDVEEMDWHSLLYSQSSNLELPTPSLMYTMGESCFRMLFRVWNSLTVKGKENIPANGPYILAANHQSFVDGPLVFSGLTNKQMRNIFTYATEEHIRGNFRRFLARNNNVIIMERANLKDSILKLAEVMKRGNSILIFPEGSRSHEGEVESFKKTFAILSLELGVPVVPVRITGAFQAMSRYDKFLKPRHIEVEYLPAVFASGKQTYQELSDKVRDAIIGNSL